jgi:hypothetical protein
MACDGIPEEDNMLKYETIRERFNKCLKHTQHNRLHRNINPAILWEDGDMWWCEYGKEHRSNGPAVSYQCGEYTEWYTRGSKICPH